MHWPGKSQRFSVLLFSTVKCSPWIWYISIKSIFYLYIDYCFGLLGKVPKSFQWKQLPYSLLFRFFCDLFTFDLHHLEFSVMHMVLFANFCKAFFEKRLLILYLQGKLCYKVAIEVLLGSFVA